MFIYHSSLPDFTLSKLVEASEEPKSRLQHEKAHISAIMDAANDIWDGDAIFIFIRKKLEDGEYQYGCIGRKLDGTQMLAVGIDNFDNIPPTIIGKRGLCETVWRVIKNLVFS